MLVVLLMVAPVRVSAWDNTTTHPEITDAARARVRNFDEILENQYGLTDGRATELAVQRGFGSIELQVDVSGGRFERRLGAANPDPPDNVRLIVSDQCSLGPDFEVCFMNLERASVSKLLRAGAYAEDAPSVRAQHHFHDPVRTHGNPTTTTPSGFPADNRGQDNTRILSLSSFDEFIANLATSFLFGGGDFRLFGRSARDRALNLGFAEDGEPKNYFDLPDAERYLYRAFTSSIKDEREHFMALHFLAVGSVLHLLEDMSSVAHTRNDFIVDHVKESEANLEKVGGFDAAIDLINSLERSGGGLLTSLPSAELVKFDSDRFTAQFDSNLPNVDTTAFDADEFWQRPEGAASPEQLGLAEFVNPRFFSHGTTSNTHEELGYPFPLVPPCEDGAEVGSGAERVSVIRLPARTLAEGEIHRPNVERLFLSSSLVPHLARCSFHGVGRNGAQRLRMAPWAYSVIDESVQRDYLELLLPLGIDYTQKFLEFYFQPRIDVVPTGNNEFDLINRASKSFTASTDELKIYYDDVEGFRQSVVIECNTAGDSEFTLVPDAHLECEMPTLIPDGLTAPRSRGDFSVVIRGQLGTRGSVVTPVDSVDDADFVTAVRRVFGWQIAYEGNRVDPTVLCETIDESTECKRGEDIVEEDEKFVRDVYRIAFDLKAAQDPMSEPASAVLNLTNDIRDTLDESIRREVDFQSPSAEPGGSRIALSSDLGLEDGSVLQQPNRDAERSGRFVASDIHLLDIRDTTVLTSIEVPAGDIPVCNFGCPPVWNSDSNQDVIDFSTGGEPPGMAQISQESIARHTIGEGTISQAFEPSRQLAVTSSFGDSVIGLAQAVETGETPNTFYVADVTTGVSSHLLNLESFTMVACDDVIDPSLCARPNSPQTSYGADPQYSPDGTKIALAVFADPTPNPGDETPRHNGSIFVADFGPAGGGEITELVAADGQAAYPAWSPDGEWIAFQRSNDFHLYVVSAAGGEAFRVSQDAAARSELTWLPSLLLPQ